MKTDCQHPRTQERARYYGYRLSDCLDCGHTLGEHVMEPLDLRLFGQLRTFLGDPPDKQHWSK